MKYLVGLLVLSGLAAAELDFDRVTEWVEAEEFERAYEVLHADPAPDRGDARFWDLWQRAVRGVARNRQRRGGYGEAIAFLEDHLDTRSLVEDYAETCIWAGEEQRGLDRMGALPQPMRDRCAYAEFQLHWVRQDYAALEQRAREVGRPKWVDFAREQRELRERFDNRTTRAWWVTILGTLAILLTCWITDRALRRHT